MNTRPEPLRTEPFTVARALRGEAGATGLATLVSSVSAMLFLCLFYSSVQYVTARTSVEAAARAALRCVFPTDGRCRTAAVGSDGTVAWYFVPTGDRTIRRVNRYRYSAAMVRQRWRAEVDGFELRTLPLPQVIQEVSLVPRRIFRAQLNDGFYRYLDLDAAVTVTVPELVRQYAPKYPGENFPAFDLEFERSRDRADPGSWHPIYARRERGTVRTESAPFGFQLLSLGAGEIPVQGQIKLESPVVTVPEYPDVGSAGGTSIECRSADGAPCDVTGASGGTGRWSETAALALKPFAFVRSLSADRAATVRWGQAGGGEGFRIRIWSRGATARRAQGENIGPDVKDFCLGGRTWSPPIGGEGEWYNLWLRGPKGSTGGSSAVCENGRTTHFPIEVPRGGSFQVVAWLSSGSGSSPALAEVSVGYYFDEYEPHDLNVARIVHTHCIGSAPVLRGKTPESCPIREVCPSMEVVNIEGCNTHIRDIPACTRGDGCPIRSSIDDARFYPLPPEYCGPERTISGCDATSSPEEEASCADVPAARSVMGWTAVAQGVEQLPGVLRGSTCGGATNGTLALSCGTPETLPFGQYPPDFSPAQCPVVRAAIAQSIAAVGVEPSTMRPASVDDFRWGPEPPTDLARWEFSLTPSDSRGRTPQVPDGIRPAILTLENDQPIFKHVDPAWQPGAGAFARAEVVAGAARPRIALIGEEMVPIEATYPFNVPATLELPMSAVDHESAEDDRGCDTGLSLESRLRQYAARQIPDAADLSVEFQGEGHKVDTVEVSSSPSCSRDGQTPSVELPPCTPVAESQQVSERCAAPQFLGKFDISQYPDGPPACVDRANGYCVSVSLGADDAPTASEPDARAVANIALEELRRAFPGVAADCERPGCARAALATTGDSASVTVTYEHPIGFPLSAILGRDSLTVRSDASAAVENKLLGSRSVKSSY